MKRGRFAPTPSGDMHLGNAKIALLSWLQMRAVGGIFVLRIEDIDIQRSKPEITERILTDLRWLGLDWDEGPGASEVSGPYYQSQRTELYEEALAKLAAEGRLYPCFCSRAELLAVAGAPHGLSSEGAPYPGTCRGLSPEERERRAQHKEPSLRFAIGPAAVSFIDGIAGPQVFPPGSGGDFVVRRADRMYSYQLAVTVDDARMGITDVLRGDDLLDSTPRQLHLYTALGLTPPDFAHAPLILGEDGRRLAKRHGDLGISALRAAGTKPETVIGWLAYISGLLDQPEDVSAKDLINGFHLDRISREPFVLTETMVRQLLPNTSQS
ncbi:tRNA glutamyl-Q(34) synthetase GluQRS [Paenibacillus sp. MBLB2552]|uniref:Glutamyl-Q tRNA(Asp) synthetase n=1 Tax=Paenibacillus mellifer TaxID=2937794 RepID=A0A9X1XYU1_9BACL|nr:tRNA glutamyl-Q(34) synthetase GluQRS [Paenibacillus mellifer]MCK8488470.1 tRNA glutamyl-Q(34) synthetase GluQRS [Paenibacillus mellifer]